MTPRLFSKSLAIPSRSTTARAGHDDTCLRRWSTRLQVGQPIANLCTAALRWLTTKHLNNTSSVMTTDHPAPTLQGWRAHVPRDPIGQRLKTISFLNREIGKKIGEALGVNVTDMAALEQLLNNGPLTPSQLAERLKVTTAAATQIVDRLERAGHVSRQRKATDRRKIFVVPVEASMERAFEKLAPMIDGLDRVIAGLTPAERQIIEGFLDQVVDVYRDVAGLPPSTADSC
ncbi:MarR family winged helix-turn-helix transcriptional regulator [Caulobacter sp. DWR3-1-2]|uniref:MarR family winged helix-turn-helix transcriptional regulator n=1 Tax=Caulobacter sp. DWR3-1-2 TaxID=2804647 RepID=UPI003CEA526E